MTSQSRGNDNQGVASQPSNHGKLNCSKRDLKSQLSNNDNETGHTHKCVTHNIMRDGYKWCEWLQKFINKKIIIQKLNARRCKEQLNTFSIPGASEISAPFLALHDIRLCTTHAAMKAVKLVQLLFVPFGPSSCSGLQLQAEEKAFLSEKHQVGKV